MTTCKQLLQQVANKKPHSGYIVFYIQKDPYDFILQVALVNNLRNKSMFQRVVATIDHLEKRYHTSVRWYVWKDEEKPKTKIPKVLRVPFKNEKWKVTSLSTKEVAKWSSLVSATEGEQEHKEKGFFLCPKHTPLETFQQQLRSEWNELSEENERASLCTIIAGTTFVACDSLGNMKKWLERGTLPAETSLNVALRVCFSRNKKEVTFQLNEWTNERLIHWKRNLKVENITDASFLNRTVAFQTMSELREKEVHQRETIYLEAHLSERETKKYVAALIEEVRHANLLLFSAGTNILHLAKMKDVQRWTEATSNEHWMLRKRLRVDAVRNKKEGLRIINEKIVSSSSSYTLASLKVEHFIEEVASTLFLPKEDLFHQNKSEAVALSSQRVEDERLPTREEARSNQSPLEQSVTKGTPREQRNRARTIAETKTKDLVNVYVDGSYLPNVGISAYGFVAEDESGMEVQKDFGMTVEERLRELGSLGAELHACLRGIEWAIANNYQTVRIYYDFIGIIQKLQEEQSKTKHERMYFGLYEMYSEHIRILFRKVSPSGKEGRAHLRAHDLSRLPSTLYMN